MGLLLSGWVLTRRGMLLFVAAAALLVLIGGASRLIYAEVMGSRELELARKAFAEHRLERADEHLAKSIHHRPGSFEAHFLAARVNRIMEKYDDADQHLARCVAVAGGKTTDKVQFERLLIRASRGGMIEVVGDLQPYISNNSPEQNLVREAMAVGWLARSALGPARELTDDWIKLEPENPRAHLMLGKIFAKTGNYGFARPPLEEADRLRPDDTNTQAALGEVLTMLGVRDKAVIHLEALRTKKHDLAQTLPLLITCRREMQQYDRASELIREALDLDPENVVVLIEKAVLEQARGNTQAAVEQFKDLLERDPFSPQIHKNLADCYRKLEKDDLAEHHQKRSKALDEDMKRVDRITRRELPGNPRDPKLLHELGTIYYRNGKIEQALRYLESVLRIDPEFQDTHKILGEYYRKVGDVQRAMYHMQKAPKSEP